MERTKSTRIAITGDFLPLLTHSAFAVIGDKIYVFGGIENNLATNAIFEISLSGKCRRLRLCGNLPSARWGHRGWTHDGKLIFHGGKGPRPDTNGFIEEGNFVESVGSGDESFVNDQDLSLDLDEMKFSLLIFVVERCIER